MKNSTISFLISCYHVDYTGDKNLTRQFYWIGPRGGANRSWEVEIQDEQDDIEFQD